LASARKVVGSLVAAFSIGSVVQASGVNEDQSRP
jgi:hypothetical protein